jgi:Glycosyl hydrolase family 26
VTRAIAVLTAAVALAAAGASSSGGGVEARRVLLGVLGDTARFQAHTGQRSPVIHRIVGWDQGHTWGSRFGPLFATMGEVPLLGLKTSRGGAEAITPRAIAQGTGDAYLVALNGAVAEWSRPIYVRPFGEMNGHWNVYCAFNRDGTSRGPTHSTAAFRNAFARVYLILHGGPGVNTALRRLGLPPVTAALAENPPARIKVIWNPQGYGNPDIPGNRAAAYYPGDRYVDVVGNDLYNQGNGGEWAANERLYDAHRSKPYAVVEWANWGRDDAAFVRRMAEFVRTHRRVELVAYYNGAAGSPWDIARQPASRAVYRSVITPLG